MTDVPTPKRRFDAEQAALAFGPPWRIV
jgi:hypothetical protein